MAVVLFALGLALAGCASQQAPSPTTTGPAPASSETGPPPAAQQVDKLADTTPKALEKVRMAQPLVSFSFGAVYAADALGYFK